MPARIIVFNAIQAVACIYALKRGGAPERWVAWMMAGGAATSAFAARALELQFGGFNGPMFTIDALLLVGFCLLALRANRFWPWWVASFQLLAIGVHVTMIAYPTILDTVYNRTVGKAAYPMIMLLVIGTQRHYRRQQIVHDEDWSPLRW